MYKKQKTILCIAIFLVLSVSVVVLAQYIDDNIINGGPDYLNQSRPNEALVKPDIPDKVADVRVQVKERDCGGNIPQGYTAMQIYYGFYSDGKWHDYPCENYDLAGIYFNRSDFGYDAAGEHHVVKLGDKILIALHSYRSNDIMVSDTLGSEVMVIDEYFTKTVFKEVSGNVKTEASMVGGGYAYLKENALELGEDDYKFSILGAFDKWYYVTIDESELTDDYTLTFTNIGAENSDFDFIVTYNDIITALNYVNEVEPK